MGFLPTAGVHLLDQAILQAEGGDAYRLEGLKNPEAPLEVLEGDPREKTYVGKTGGEKTVLVQAPDHVFAGQALALGRLDELELVEQVLLEGSLSNQGIEEKLSFFLGLRVAQLGFALVLPLEVLAQVLLHLLEDGELIREIHVGQVIRRSLLELGLQVVLGFLLRLLGRRLWILRELLRLLGLLFIGRRLDFLGVETLVVAAYLLEQGICLELLEYGRPELQGRNLQNFQGLAQLRSQDQTLRLFLDLAEALGLNGHRQALRFRKRRFPPVPSGGRLVAVIAEKVVHVSRQLFVGRPVTVPVDEAFQFRKHFLG